MEQVSLIFTSLLQLARSVGSVPDEVVRELVQCETADIDARLRAARTDVIGTRIPDDVPQAITEALEDPAGGAESELDIKMDRRPFVVEIRGMPLEKVEPMVRFVVRDGRWRFERFSSASRRHEQLKRIPPFSLNCAVCEKVNLAELTKQEMHGVMTAWTGIRLLVCPQCALRVRTPAHMAPGACFCCTSTDAVDVYRRSDNLAVVVLCRHCTGSKWLEVLETAGIVLERVPFPSYACRVAVTSTIATSPIELKEAYQRAKRPAEDPLPDAKRVARECGHADVAAYCAHAECETTICGECLARRYGPLALMYHEPVRLWRCSDHFPTLPSDAAH